ncbi:MAG TPA: VOC family protein, partial [Patescibacteria group bacterium]|nr:VOC family protein [Patescibacteria group bacterium]
NFIHKHGDMQVMEVSIRVDSIRHAVEEMRQWSESQQLTTRNYHEDTFGNCVTVDFVFLYRQAFQYSFTQRLDKFIPGIDHVAIAVDSLDQYVQLYKDFGFHVVYAPRKKKGLIQGERSAMRTYALRRGGLTIALVQGVDQKDTSQVTMYVRQHGNHSLHHAALLTTHLSKMVASYLANGIGFRLYRVPEIGMDVAPKHIVHQSNDADGSFLQCFTKPFTRIQGHGGFFFELIERLSSEKETHLFDDRTVSVRSPSRSGVAKTQSFDDKTVAGLHGSVEREMQTHDNHLFT